jgi:hypothetical protein
MHSLKIITIHLNNSKGFEKTFNSVYSLLLNSSKIHWVVKDGNSDEQELKKIKNQLERIDSKKYQFIQKPDLGIYDAMNQALELVDNEDQVLFLNSGDQLSDEFVKSFNSWNNLKADIFYSNTIVGNKLIQTPNTLDFAFLLGKTINHQSLIIKGALLKKHVFKIRYKIVADWIQLFEILKNETCEIKKLQFPICIYEGGGISEKQDELRKHERHQYLHSVYSKWELESLEKLKRLRQRSWFEYIVKSLDSPRRGKLVGFIAKCLK